jgi:hypothetical protein
MTIKRATLSIVGASLLVAWFASAASISLQRPRRYTPPPAPEASSIDMLGLHVRERAAQLKARLAAPPAPQQPTRNPFAFREIMVPRRVAPAMEREARTIELPVLPSEPQLILIGIAGKKNADGLARTAMLATQGDDVIIAAVGDVILQRYKVISISADAVELADVETGTPRRLAFQQL